MEINNVNKICLSAFTGGVNTPSSRFRLRQYVPYLAGHGIEVVEHIPYFEKSCGLPSLFTASARVPGLIRARKSDITWVGKELVKGYCYLERFMKRPRIFDVDDAIWLSKPFGRWSAPAIARQMDVVVAGNNYLAEYFSKYNKNVRVLPTAIDTGRFQPVAEKSRDRFVIGWTGLARNFCYLDMIAGPLGEFLSEHEDARFMVVSNRQWNNSLTRSPQYKFVQWSADREVADLHAMDVGLMPLEDSRWEQGKCSFKMLQYLAVGVPAIVSPVGMNIDVLARGEVGYGAESSRQWYDILTELYNDRDRCVELGRNGRDVVARYYSAEKVACELAGIIRELVTQV
ncbi:MAG: glycosyltransferase family 4 protein [Sedimentisphaerales bacterium]|nr:glycosyltransferase family 4 protein [Sedimentisphaerales bacterium]MBN2841863.1 glycosyltransferase family 4 protein [Sedimentisphaerales bacterium]